MEEIRAQTANAIQSVKLQVRWRPGSAVRHLLKRKLRGHLPVEATISDYERIIQMVLEDTQAKVYIYRYNHIPYVTVVALVQNHPWLVMFHQDGLMESAYIVERPDHYLNKPAFELLGRLEEVIR